MRIAMTIFFTVIFAPWAAGLPILMMWWFFIPPGPVMTGIICIVALFGTWVTVAEKMKEAFPRVNHTMDRAAMRRLSTR